MIFILYYTARIEVMELDFTVIPVVDRRKERKKRTVTVVLHCDYSMTNITMLERQQVRMFL